jgi:hypothetical protein
VIAAGWTLFQVDVLKGPTVKRVDTEVIMTPAMWLIDKKLFRPERDHGACKAREQLYA